MSKPSRLARLTTEQINPASAEIDRLAPIELVQLMNREDTRVAEAVGKEASAIARAIEVIADRLRRGGRLIYIGAGTSGRLGVLDAAECPPTFRTPPELVVGLIAGGRDALVRSAEGKEDHPEFGQADLEQIGLDKQDVVVGIATSGRTPYVIGALAYARDVGAATIGLTCNEDSDLAAVSQIMIAPIVGPEVITGSTRLKAGTATKMVLNMLSTGTMVQLGKTYGNLMVDLRATNSKLKDRAVRIVQQLSGCDAEEASRLLRDADGEVKTALVCRARGVDAATARKLLRHADGHLRRVLEADP